MPAVSSDGLRTPLTPGPGAGVVGPGCTGCTLPPTTWPTVRTMVLFVVARGASHATNWLKMVGDTESSSHPDPAPDVVERELHPAPAVRLGVRDRRLEG